MRVITAALVLLCPVYCAAEDWRQMFTDPVDGRLDASRWVLSRHGLLPTPIIITEPAVGYGGGAVLVFFHQKEASAAARSSASASSEQSRFTPPSVSMAFAAATENGTKLGGAGHLGVWRDDTVRFTGAIAAASINLKFYGGENFPRLSDGVVYSLEGAGAFTQALWRIRRSDVWIGPQLIYLDADVQFDRSLDDTIFAALNRKLSSAGAGLAFSYDSRNNIFTPSGGLQLDWYVREHWGEFGGDFDYLEIDGKNRWYIQAAESIVLGLRLDMSFVSGDTPFFALPSINQRGIPAARYQGEAVVAGELELRYGFDERWFGVLFTGVGNAADSIDEIGSADERWAGGVGIRYLVARALGLQMGVDIAKGPEDWAFYIQMGSGWSF